MRALIQRVRNAEVNVRGEVVGAIGQGMLILLGVGKGDSVAEADWLADKCAQLRIFDDEEGQLNRSLLEVGGGALVVSQFTLYADPRKGRRPSYSAAAAGEEAHALFLRFCEKLQELDVPVERGEFGERMEICLVNDGPVTLMVETPRR